MSPQYDSPNAIDNVELTLYAVSHNPSPKVYANGLNRLPIEITVKAMSDEDEILNFSHDTWIKMLSLCFSESDEKLTRKGDKGWRFTEEENAYSKEFPGQIYAQSKSALAGINNGSTSIILYVYTDLQDIRRISVCLDTAAGTEHNKHFTTADNATGSERMSVQVVSKNPLVYRVEDLKITPIYALNPTRAKVHYKMSSGSAMGASFDDYDTDFPCHYDNYYISLGNNNRIIKADIHAYGSVNGPYKWISAYDSHHNDQHMIVVHPFNTGQQTEEFGFENTAKWSASGWGWRSVGEAKFSLKQTVTYNEKPHHICLTQMAFASGQRWMLPDGYGLDISGFSFDTWFELYDEYGNSGKFTVTFTTDNSYIELMNR